MPSQEGRGGRPSREPNREDKEREQPLYYQAARFDGELSAAEAYMWAQEVIFNDPKSNLSVFRLQIESAWHVAALGDPPLPETDIALAQILSIGELVELPAQAISFLQERRKKMSKGASWVEGHYRPGKRFEL
jgi:hypothetical protein